MLKKSHLTLILILPLILFIISCGVKDNKTTATMDIIVTSESGDKMATKNNVTFKKGLPTGTIVTINPEITKQTMDGIGSSFTESSAFVLAHLEEAKRHEVMNKIFSEDGANFTLTRTHIGACDFCVDGKYSYADTKDDDKLKHFDIAPDKSGFDTKRFPGLKDPNYDLLPMIKEAEAIKNNQQDKELRIVASAWTAPSWMKDIEDWYIPGSEANNWNGTGGHLKEEYIPLYADYIVKYLDAYNQEGIDIWGITPVNEPHGNSGQWESMHFTPETQNEFIKKYLGPKLKASEFKNTKLLIYDQNRDGMEEWVDGILSDSETAPYVYGTAVHWYAHTEQVFEEVFEKVHAKYPDFAIIHSEGCIDDLGKPPYDGIGDPEGFQEKDWFENDAFWWNKNATDWGYTAAWAGEMANNHPMHTPVHRYARNIIVSINHWLQGWIDWNIVLDKNGGPNHVGNFCGAPIMIDTENQNVYYTPIYYVLAQFSRTIRPGDKAVQTELKSEGLNADDLHACATINDKNTLSVQLLNTTKRAIAYSLAIGDSFGEIVIPANSVQTVRVQL